MNKILVYFSRAIAFVFVLFAGAALPTIGYGAPYFEKKTVTVIVPSGAGGSYDLYTRIFARHYSRHVPGHPTIIVTNMPGAGGARAAGYLYNKAPRDGTWLGLISQTAALFQLLRSKGITYKSEEFSYLGRMASSNGVVAVWHTAPATTLEQAKTSEVIFGSSGKGSQTYMTPTMMRNLLGYKFRVIPGYRGAEKTLLAMERGEVHARTGSIESLRAKHADWIKSGKIRIWAEVGLAKSPEIPDVPLLTDLAEKKEDKQIIRLLSSYTALGFHFGGPPGIPRDRLAMLRTAFDATMKDPELVAEMKKRKIALRPATGAAVEEIVRETIATPPEIIARAKKVLEW